MMAKDPTSKELYSELKEAKARERAERRANKAHIRSMEQQARAVRIEEKERARRIKEEEREREEARKAQHARIIGRKI